MPPVMMSHPKHGRTPAVGAEVAWNQAHGWTIDKPEEPPAAADQKYPTGAHELYDLAVPEPAPPAPQLSLRDQYTAKFGREPHHLMKQETIERRLKE